MTDDLVRRLRERDAAGGDYCTEWGEAADRIEQLNRSSEGWKEIADEYFDAIGERNIRIEKLKAALREIDEWAEEQCYVGLRKLISSALEWKKDD